MNSPTSTSPRQKLAAQANSKIKELALKGEWPPEGHPLKALVSLPKQGVLLWFQSPEWAALLEGLCRWQADSRAVAMDVSKPQAVRDEACGIVKMLGWFFGLPEDLKALYRLMEKE